MSNPLAGFSSPANKKPFSPWAWFAFTVFFAALTAFLVYAQTRTPTQTALATPAPSAAPAPPAQQIAVRDHYYDVKDGVGYGYTSELSAAQRQTGQVGNNIVMFSYAGQRDGKHQVHSRDGTVVHAFECSAPCEVIKVLSVIDASGLRQDATVQRLRATPTMIAAMALTDAMNGKLQEYVQYPDGDGNAKGRQVALWVDEQRGLTRTAIKKASPNKPS